MINFTLAEDYGVVQLPKSKKDTLNKICAKYCGYKEPGEIVPLWDELTEQGIDPIIVMGYPDNIAEDGGKSWTIRFTIDGNDVENSRFIYQVYEPAEGTKNDYNIYFS